MGAHRRGQHNYPPRNQRGPDDMDVDTISAIQQTPEERQKCILEGRCFICQQKGHLSGQCPKNPRKSGNAQKRTNQNGGRNVFNYRQPAKSRVTDTESIAETETTMVSIPDMIEAARTLSTKERNDLVDGLMLTESGF